MICSSSSPPIRRRPGEGRGPRGFTLVELLAVILILAVLIALLLPALNRSVWMAKNAAVGSEINQLAQALASFKARYGDYPPSRIYLVENGDYSVVNSQNGSIALGPGDITIAQLAQRSLAAMRKFFPRVVLSTSGAVFPGPTYNRWYDFNGNGGTGPDGPYILQGHECLVFFLGGITQSDSYPITANSKLGMTGFGKDPTNPFTNSLVGNTMYSANRQAPLFEFAGNRLFPDPLNPAPAYPTSLGLVSAQIPGYLDSLGNTYVEPDIVNHINGTVNFYTYFSAYGNGGYDPNDVNFNEYDNEIPPQLIGLTFHVAFPVPGASFANSASSPAPNPYTSAVTAPFNTATSPPTPLATTYLNPQTFQIISSGSDGLYGVGGQYSPDSAGETLPWDSTPSPTNPPYYTSDTTIRIRERDNITNFHNGRPE